MSGLFYSHIESSSGRTEDLAVHLREVATRAAQFGAGTCGRAGTGKEPAPQLDSWAELAGWWHDFGKHSDHFQRYIQRESGLNPNMPAPAAVDHSTAGAVLATRRAADLPEPVARIFLQLVAYAIAGHHAGLADSGPVEAAGTLAARLAKGVPEIADAFLRAPRPLFEHKLPSSPALLCDPCGVPPAFRLALWTRMLFSCLVDSDYLATEQFMNPSRSAARPADGPLEPLLGRITQVVDAKSAGAKGRVAEARRMVVADCRAAAERPPGLFTLTVPTGGGKTLSSMNFALSHAVRHGLHRVVVAVPFTSIIDQNADVYRATLGAEVVLEHHSNYDPVEQARRDRADPAHTSALHAMVSENWDSPVVLTTTVQLFESLFAARPSVCRKLHRIARSVIVLDEAQALPVTLLEPLLATLRELVEVWGCSVVLCTATQPALGFRTKHFEIGLPLSAANEIIRDVPSLFAGLRRTRVRPVGPRTDEQIVTRLLDSPAALCIVNTRRHASRLFGLLRANDPTALHLSANMCPAHRVHVIEAMRRRLAILGTETDRGVIRANETSCRVVSTQVIEAGVDVDFPVVLRAMAGLDSIAQSAGRCNREGRLPLTDVEIFEPDADSEGKLPYDIANPRDATMSVLPDHLDDPLSPSAIDHFFRERYMRRGWPRGERPFDCGRAGESGRAASRSVMQCFRVGVDDGGAARIELDFRTASERFAMIDDRQQAVIVPYGRKLSAGERLTNDVLTMEGPELIEHVRLGRPLSREFLRRAQRYSVNVARYRVDAFSRCGWVSEPVTESGVWILDHGSAYDVHCGLLQDENIAAPCWSI